MHLGEERAEMALHAVQLGGEVADVGALDLLGRDPGALERADHRLAHQRGEVLVLFGPVAGEIGHVTAQDVDLTLRCHRFLLISTRDEEFPGIDCSGR